METNSHTMDSILEQLLNESDKLTEGLKPMLANTVNKLEELRNINNGNLLTLIEKKAFVESIDRENIELFATKQKLMEIHDKCKMVQMQRSKTMSKLIDNDTIDAFGKQIWAESIITLNKRIKSLEDVIGNINN